MQISPTHVFISQAVSGTKDIFIPLHCELFESGDADDGRTYWNVSEAYRFGLLSGWRRRILTPPWTDEDFRRCYPDLDRAAALAKADERPMLIVERDPEQPNYEGPGDCQVLDGYHRLFKWIHEGRGTILAIRVPLTHRERFILGRTARGVPGFGELVRTGLAQRCACLTRAAAAEGSPL